MIRFSRLLPFGLAMLTLGACGARPPSQPVQAVDSGAQSERLGQIVERYWAENAALMPWYSWGSADMEFSGTPAENIAPQSLADSLALERRYLAEVSAVPRAS